ncbi:MAG: hypothetical protein MJE68_05515, partial [Proteobacteria bacterium]|nr:hypothetical protein [Pseudomonadota bacterium]
GKRNAAKQPNAKLKLSLDPIDDVEENTCFKTKHAACVARGEGTGEVGTKVTGGEGTEDGTNDTKRENTGDDQGESIEDENLRHMLSDKECEHGYADVESENECYDNEPINEQDDQITYQVMGKRNAAEQHNTKLKLSLDPIDDVEENTCFNTKHAACVSKS